MAVQKVVQGDTGTKFRFNIVDQNNNIVNLSGATVMLYIERPDVTLEKTCQIIGAASGIAEYVTTSNDLSVGDTTYFLTVNVQLSTGSFTAISKTPISVLPNR
jgi:hypothetical protein